MVPRQTDSVESRLGGGGGGLGILGFGVEGLKLCWVDGSAWGKVNFGCSGFIRFRFEGLGFEGLRSG